MSTIFYKVESRPRGWSSAWTHTSSDSFVTIEGARNEVARLAAQNYQCRILKFKRRAPLLVGVVK